MAPKSRFFGGESAIFRCFFEFFDISKVNCRMHMSFLTGIYHLHMHVYDDFDVFKLVFYWFWMFFFFSIPVQTLQMSRKISKIFDPKNASSSLTYPSKWRKNDNFTVKKSSSSLSSPSTSRGGWRVSGGRKNPKSGKIDFSLYKAICESIL